MLAFLDSPVQLIIAAVVILIVFGPQKLPEIAGQVGRALRELKRTTSELQDTLSLDHSSDHNNYESSYNPPTYDSYGNPGVQYGLADCQCCRKRTCGSLPIRRCRQSPPGTNRCTAISPRPRFRMRAASTASVLTRRMATIAAERLPTPRRQTPPTQSLLIRPPHKIFTRVPLRERCRIKADRNRRLPVAVWLNAE